MNANADACMNSVGKLISSNKKGNNELLYGSKSMAKFHLVNALNHLADAHRLCNDRADVLKALTPMDKSIKKLINTIK